MAYDSARIVVAGTLLIEQALTAPRTSFDRREHFALLVGGAGLGALGGFALAMGLGYQNLALTASIAAPLLAFALYLTSRTLTEAIEERAYGCATATVMHSAALVAWPMAALLAPLSPLNFWTAPALAMSALVMFASCWQGPQRAVYRLSAQALLVGIVAAHHGTMLVMGG